MDNATTAVNTILRLYPFEKGDKIVMPTTVYESCGDTVKFLQKRIGVEPVLVEIDYPLNGQIYVSWLVSLSKCSKGQGLNYVYLI